MTIFKRAATIAAMCFTFTGLLAGSQGSAHELSTATAAIEAPVMNGSTPMMVPDTDPVLSGETLSAATETTGFDTLAQAVAAHDTPEPTDTVRCLAGAIYFEAKGEPLAGQLAVAEVILNRAQSGRFPADACGVVLQRGQFGFVRAGRIPTIDATRAAYRTAIAVARVAMAKAWDSPARAALYFNTPGNPPASRLVRIAVVGNHVFYR